MPASSPVDTLGRPMRDLRISVTDRCNLRCNYCMPAEIFDAKHEFLPRNEILSLEEIARVAAVAARLGVTKLRITGGEPLLRRNLPALITLLADIEGIDDLTLTTNGLLLAAQALDLKAAGLDRVTVSLDTLDDETFHRLTSREYSVHQVLEGIAAARTAGFTSVKVNAVIRRGFNEGEILSLCRHFRETPGIVLRFIEFMDVGTTNGWRLDEVVSAKEIRDIIAARFPLEPLDPNYRGEVATRYRYTDGRGEIGIISSVTAPFCGTCNRARLSAKGELFTCLFAGIGYDVKTMMRSGASDKQLAVFIGNLWRARDDRYSELRSANTFGTPKVEMSYIGG